MADIRIKDLATTASVTASDDFMAVDGVTYGTRKLSAATPAFLTSVTTPSLTAPASTDLTLSGGSTGASLVLGATASGNIDNFSNGYHTWRRGGTTKMFLTASDNLLIGTTTDAANLAGGLVINGSGTASAASNTTTGALRVTGGVGVSGAGYFGGNILSVAGKLVNSAANGATLPASNGLFQVAGQTVNGLELIGKGSTTDFVLYNSAGTSIAQVATGASTLTIPLTTSASSSTVGALTIGNGTAATNVAIGGGAIYAGGVVTAKDLTLFGTTGSAYITGGTGHTYFQASGGTAFLDMTPSYFELGGGTLRISGTTGTSYTASTTTSTNSTTGAFRVGDGTTAATNVGIGGGKVNIGSTEASVGSTSGALQVAGGIYAGAASVLNTTTLKSDTGLKVERTSSDELLQIFGGATFGISVTKTTGTFRPLAFYTSDSERMRIAVDGTLSTQGAATFAGAVTIGNTVNSVSPTSPNRTITMVVGGVTLYIAAKTTND